MYTFDSEIEKYMELMGYDVKTQLLRITDSLKGSIERSEDPRDQLDHLVTFYIFMDAYTYSMGISKQEINDQINDRLDRMKTLTNRLEERALTIKKSRDKLNSETGLSTLKQKGLMSKRLSNLLKRNGIFNLHEIHNITVKEIMSINGFGPESFKELMAVMENYDLSFKEEK